MKLSNHIRKNVEFNKVIDEGKLIKSDSLTLYFLENNLNYSRIGISVPKKSGNAVVRNKMKRQIRAIVASNLSLDKSIDYVFIVRKQYDIGNFNKTKSDFDYLINKVG